jgi:hypothetical protein
VAGENGERIGREFAEVFAAEFIFAEGEAGFGEEGFRDARAFGGGGFEAGPGEGVLGP